MNKEYNISDIAFDIGSAAMQAVLYEAACFPSPGLVSPISDGAHKDMDYYLFLDSSAALIKPFLLCAQCGGSDKSAEEIFTHIRSVGILGEESMFKATKGINTHKGILFLMGLGCAAVAKALHEGMEFKEVQQLIRLMTKGITEKELHGVKAKEENMLSNGEKLFLKHGVTGVRGEAEKGLPIVFDYALELYSKCEEMYINDRLLHTLMGIMQHCEDTTILHRHSSDILKEVQAKAKFIVALGGMKTDFGVDAVYSLDKEFKRRNISPGGSADLLALTVFFHNIKSKLFKDK